MNPAVREPWLSSAEVCHLTGATYRQLDYWDRTHVIRAAVPAQGSGTRRQWSPDQLRRIRALVALSALLGLGRGGVDDSLSRIVPSGEPPWVIRRSGVTVTVEFDEDDSLLH